MIKIQDSTIQGGSNKDKTPPGIDKQNSETLLGILHHIPRTARTLDIDIPLYGSLDLGILTAGGYSQIHTITIVPGHLEEIHHIPKTVRVFKCPQNDLHHVDEIPVELDTLDLHHNQLTDANLTTLFPKMSRVRILNLSWNQLTSLPVDRWTHVAELRVESNDLKTLDLDFLNSLKVLYVGKNPRIRLFNVREDSIDIHREIDGSPTQIQHSSKILGASGGGGGGGLESKMDPDEAISQYFQWKQYQEEIRQVSLAKNSQNGKMSRMSKKSKKSSKQCPCAHCGRLGKGLEFVQDAKYYTAQCTATDPEPCHFRISIRRGKYQDLYATLQQKRLRWEQAAESIFQETALSMHQIMDPNTTSTRFERELKRFLVSQDEYQELLDRYLGNETKTKVLDKDIPTPLEPPPQKLVSKEEIHKLKIQIEEGKETLRNLWKRYQDVWSGSGSSSSSVKKLEEAQKQTQLTEIVQESLGIQDDLTRTLQAYQTALFSLVEMESTGKHTTTNLYRIRHRESGSWNWMEIEKPVVELWHIDRERDNK